MNRELIQKLIGGALVLSGVVLLVLKVLSISEARESWAAWASPESGMIWLVGALVLELVFLLARFILGYLVFLSGRIKLRINVLVINKHTSAYHTPKTSIFSNF